VLASRGSDDPQGSNRVGIILEVPDMASFEKMLEADPTVGIGEGGRCSRRHRDDSPRGIAAIGSPRSAPAAPARAAAAQRERRHAAAQSSWALRLACSPADTGRVRATLARFFVPRYDAAILRP
jgi:hypothetical protein